MKFSEGANVFPFRNPRLTGVVVNIDGNTALVDWGDSKTAESEDTVAEIVPAWTHIEILPMYLPFHNGHTYHRTEKCNWCNADSVVYVSRTSGVSGNTYTDPACEQHAEEWRKASETL
jgi:hypothetical protein